MKSKVRNLQARVLDKDGKRSKADLKLTILDKNDNVPVFLSVSVSVPRCVCVCVCVCVLCVCVCVYVCV